MFQPPRTIACSLAVLLVAGAMAPVAADAWQLGNKANPDRSATQTQEKRISVQVYNKGQTSQDLKVEGKVYTVPAHQTLTIKAPLGTAVYADSTGTEYQKGDVLFTFMPAMKDATVKFN